MYRNCCGTWAWDLYTARLLFPSSSSPSILPVSPYLHSPYMVLDISVYCAACKTKVKRSRIKQKQRNLHSVVWLKQFQFFWRCLSSHWWTFLIQRVKLCALRTHKKKLRISISWMTKKQHQHNFKLSFLQHQICIIL